MKEYGVFENIKFYLEELDVLYVLDNTEEPVRKWAEAFSAMERVRYVPFYENKGISYALNLVKAPISFG